VFVRLGWKSMPGTNTLAFYKNFINYQQKSFVIFGPGLVLDLRPKNPVKATKADKDCLSQHVELKHQHFNKGQQEVAEESLIYSFP
jgi:hypothetical protein